MIWLRAILILFFSAVSFALAFVVGLSMHKALAVAVGFAAMTAGASFLLGKTATVAKRKEIPTTYHEPRYNPADSTVTPTIFASGAVDAYFQKQFYKHMGKIKMPRNMALWCAKNLGFVPRAYEIYQVFAFTLVGSLFVYYYPDTWGKLGFAIAFAFGMAFMSAAARGFWLFDIFDRKKERARRAHLMEKVNAFYKVDGFHNV